MASTASQRITSNPVYWPEPTTVHQPHQHSRVFIGPFLGPSSKGGSSSAAGAGSSSKASLATTAHPRYPSNEVEEGDDYHVNERKRDVVRRQKRRVRLRRRASSGAAWGDDDDGVADRDGGGSAGEGSRSEGERGPRRIKRWVHDARSGGKDGGGGSGGAVVGGLGGAHVRGASAATAEEEELVYKIMAPVRDEDADADGRGWWKIRWEGDRRRMSVSSSINGPASVKHYPQRQASGLSASDGGSLRHPIRDALHASSSTGSTTMASPRFLTASSTPFVASPTMSIASLPPTETSPAAPPARPKPYLLDPRNVLRKHPSRQSSKSSAGSVITFYSARTELDDDPPDRTSSAGASAALVAAPDSDDGASRVSSRRFAPSLGEGEGLFPQTLKHINTAPLPQIVKTEASPTVSMSSFAPYTTNLPSPPPVPPTPLRSAMRKPKMPILKGPSASSPSAALPTVHFPSSPAPSIGHLLSDFKSRTAGGPRERRALEDRAEVVGSSARLSTAGGIRGDHEPAPPEEVLGREGGTGVEGDGSPMTALLFEPDEELKPGDVVLRDRMLVKKQWSRSSGLPPGYNEQTQRKIPVDRSETWEERLVVLKKGRVEIYEDWALPLRERFIGVKKLAHVIYLQKETSLSLYSHTDMTFCLLTPPTSLKDARSTRSPSGIKSRMPRFTRDGTSIFIFKIKTRTRAVDWMWELYDQLRGSQRLPHYLDVHVPAFNNARVRIRVPVVGEDAGFDSIESVLRRLTRKQIIRHCARILSEVEGFRKLLVECGALEAAEGAGVRDVDKHLALAWRHGDKLDWIWADDDVLGGSRDWNVLAGAGPLQSLTRPAKLELRLARHTASVLHLKSGTRVTEPPAVEGYIHRIRLKTQAKTLTYLTTHDGCIFICSPVKAHPPIPPRGLGIGRDASGKQHATDDMPATEREFKRGERIRAIQQILGSNGFIDFRDVAEITRATTIHVRRPRKSLASSRRRSGDDGDADDEPDDDDDDGWESLSDDERDLGGDAGLKEVDNQKTLQERRQVVIRCSNGEAHHFEAHSALIAREWIDRLNSLRSYWTEKHLEEAKQEMEVSRSTKIHLPANMPGRKQRQWDDDDELEDPDDAPAYIEDFWNWCVLDECRPIVKAGRLFSKRKHWQFRAKYNILVHGHLVQFSLDLDRPIHARSHRFFLIDAYVYTGYLAQEGLPPSSNEDAYLGKGEPRRYADGVQTSDGSEDTVLVIWYRPHFTTTSESKYLARAQQDAQHVPAALGNSGHQKLVLRARSKLERDAWAWALNLEIERLARRRKDREDRIRSAGNVL